eukprot:163934_1
MPPSTQHVQTQHVQTNTHKNRPKITYLQAASFLVINIGAAILIASGLFVSIPQSQHYAINARQITMNKQDVAKYKTFASFISIPSFYIKHGHHSIPLNDNLLTICSICSLDILSQAQALATNYNTGPLSLAVYIDKDITHHTQLRLLLLKQFNDHFHNISTTYDLTIGLIYYNKSSLFWKGMGITNDTQMAWKLPYNAMRNLAEHQVQTKWLMTVDIDFELYSSTIQDAGYLDAKLTNVADMYSKHTIFIVPAFAIEWRYVQWSNENYNNLTRTQFKNFRTIILPFKNGSQRSPFQYCTYYSKWYQTETDYAIDLHECSMWYEPYFIMNSETSREYAWDSRFAGAHLDKIQRMLFLRYHNFTAIVIRDMFMIHVNHPHIQLISKKSDDLLRQRNYCLIETTEYWTTGPNQCFHNATAYI